MKLFFIWFALICADLKFEVVNAMFIRVNGTPIELSTYDECSSCKCWTVIYNLKTNPLNLDQVLVCHRDSTIQLISQGDTTVHKYQFLKRY